MKQSMQEQLEELRKALKDKVPEQDKTKPFKVKKPQRIAIGLLVTAILGYSIYRGILLWKT